MYKTFVISYNKVFPSETLPYKTTGKLYQPRWRRPVSSPVVVPIMAVYCVVFKDAKTAQNEQISKKIVSDDV